MACVAAPSFATRPWFELACPGAPPEKEVFPEPRRNGALLAAIGRVLRGGLGIPAGPAHRGPIPERQGR